jgi:hypothetical protein
MVPFIALFGLDSVYISDAEVCRPPPMLRDSRRMSSYTVCDVILRTYGRGIGDLWSECADDRGTGWKVSSKSYREVILREEHSFGL